MDRRTNRHNALTLGILLAALVVLVAAIVYFLTHPVHQSSVGPVEALPLQLSVRLLQSA